MKIKKLINLVENHKSLYENFEITDSSALVIFDEPYGLKLLIKTWLCSFFFSYSIIVHNCNTWLDLKAARKGSGLKFTLKRFLRKSLMRRKEFVIVVADRLREYMRANGEENVIFLPFINHSKYENLIPKSRLNRLIIPGTVSLHKRYDRLVSVLCKFSEINEVVFLGRLDHNYKEQFKKLECDILRQTASKILYFESYVSADIFEGFLRSSKFCFVDFEPEIITKERYLESFTVSKESGAFWLAAKYKMSLIAPMERNDIVGLDTYGIIERELTNT